MTSQGVVNQRDHTWAIRIRRWSQILLEFLATQVVVKVATITAGFILIRALPKQEYALYAVVASMLSTSNILASLGTGVGVRSIGGRVYKDRSRFSQVVSTALSKRREYTFFALGVCLPVTAWLLHRAGASWQKNSWLMIIMLSAAVPQLSSAIYRLSLLLLGRYREVQKSELAGAVTRVVAVGTLACLHLNSLLAACVLAANSWVAYSMLRKPAHAEFDPRAPKDPEIAQEIQTITNRVFPNFVFFCIQPQVALIILAWFGNKNGMAEISALARLVALLSVFSAVFVSVLSPRVARAAELRHIVHLYLTVSLASLALFGMLFALAASVPHFLLAILGAEYRHLRAECILAFAAGCVSQFAAVLSGLNNARAWISCYSWGYVPAILSAQLLAATMLDLSILRQLLVFNLIVACAPIPVHLADAWLGIYRSK